MKFTNLPSCCTASFIHGAEYWCNKNNKERLVWLKTTLPSEMKNISSSYEDATDFDLFTFILTDNQVKNKADEILLKLGFKDVFHGDKAGEKNRHKETGFLHLYAARPREVSENRKRLIEEIENLQKPVIPPDEVLKRQKNSVALTMSAINSLPSVVRMWNWYTQGKTKTASYTLSHTGYFFDIRFRNDLVKAFQELTKSDWNFVLDPTVRGKYQSNPNSVTFQDILDSYSDWRRGIYK